MSGTDLAYLFGGAAIGFVAAFAAFLSVAAEVARGATEKALRVASDLVKSA